MAQLTQAKRLEQWSNKYCSLVIIIININNIISPFFFVSLVLSTRMT